MHGTALDIPTYPTEPRRQETRIGGIIPRGDGEVTLWLAAHQDVVDEAESASNGAQGALNALVTREPKE